MGESVYIFGRGATERGNRAFQNFANQVLSDGKERGRMFDFGNLNRVVEREHRKKGISLQSKQILLRDSTVLKYISHGKEGKLPTNEYYKLDKLIRKPTHIYVDEGNGGNREQKKKNGKGFLFVYTTRYSSGKVLKAVIQTNYGKRGMKNTLKSIGIVDKKKMDAEDENGKRQYRKIK
jgi:hypothetical protein